MQGKIEAEGERERKVVVCTHVRGWMDGLVARCASLCVCVWMHGSGCGWMHIYVWVRVRVSVYVCMSPYMYM